MDAAWVTSLSDIGDEGETGDNGDMGELGVAGLIAPGDGEDGGVVEGGDAGDDSVGRSHCVCRNA